MNIWQHVKSLKSELPSAPLGKLVLATTHIKKIHGRDAFKMLDKSLALSYGQIIH